LPGIVGQELGEDAHFDVTPLTAKVSDSSFRSFHITPAAWRKAGQKKPSENIMLSAGHTSRVMFRFAFWHFLAYQVALVSYLSRCGDAALMLGEWQKGRTPLR
jgi:hypothetical protein